MSQRPMIVAIGEVLWDVFPDGPRFGGAPANVACHAAALGADAFMVSRVGDDELGWQAIRALNQHGVNTEFVSRSKTAPTGTVQVELDARGKPRFTIRQNVAWDELAWSDDLGQLVARAHAVCFGSLGQRSTESRQVIQRFVAGTSRLALRVLDVNLRPPFVDPAVMQQSLELADVLKLSDDELPTISSICGVAGSGWEPLVQLRDRYHLRLVAMTRGERGALILGELAGDADTPVAAGHSASRYSVSDCEGVPVVVKDTVGAGDAFTAAMTCGLLAGHDLDTVNRHACQVAAHVCTHSGAQTGGAQTGRLPFLAASWPF